MSDDAEAAKSNGEGRKAFAAVLGVLAVVGGIAAIITPMRQDMEAIRAELDRRLVPVEAHSRRDGHPATVMQSVAELGRDLTRLRDELHSHEALGLHAGAATEIARLTEKLTEVETQFDWLREVIDLNDNLLGLRIERLEDRAATEGRRRP